MPKKIKMNPFTYDVNSKEFKEQAVCIQWSGTRNEWDRWTPQLPRHVIAMTRQMNEFAIQGGGFNLKMKESQETLKLN